MGYGKLLKIVHTYRNAQEVIDIAGSFIQKNASQIRKSLISPKTIINPIIVYTYDRTRKSLSADRRSGVSYAIACAVEHALEQIVEYNKAVGTAGPSKVLLLGRYGFDGDHLDKSGLFQYISYRSKIRSVKYPKMDITFMTVHSAKGLGYDNVIIINGRNETFGFPSKIEDDPVLKLVTVEDTGIEYAEERRLFYVALTRTKNRVFVIAPEQNPSEFLLEIKRDYKGVVLRGKWNEAPYMSVFRRPCPICGYPMLFRYKNAYGLRLHMCMNEPEICGFLTNEIRGLKMSIQKCDRCVDGYLVVKENTKDVALPFLGCTNYKIGGQGCNRTLTMQTYYALHKLNPDEIPRDLGKISAVPTVIKKEAGEPVVAQLPSAERLKPEVNMASAREAPVTYAPVPATQESIELSLIKIRFNDMELLELIGTVLRCAIEINEKRFVSKEVLLNVLRGSSNKTSVKYKLNQVSQYGKLATIDREALEATIDWLIAHEFLRQRNKLYPVVHLTYRGNNYLEVMTNAHLQKLAVILSETSPVNKLTIHDSATSSQKEYPVFAGKRWTEAEDKQLWEESQSGMPIAEIASLHKRPCTTIRTRLAKLRKANKA